MNTQEAEEIMTLTHTPLSGIGKKRRGGRKFGSKNRAKENFAAPAAGGSVYGWLDLDYVRPNPGTVCDIQFEADNIDGKKNVFLVQNGTESYWCDGAFLVPVRAARKFRIAKTRATIETAEIASGRTQTPTVMGSPEESNLGTRNIPTTALTANGKRYKGYWTDQLRPMLVSQRKYFSGGPKEKNSIYTCLLAARKRFPDRSYSIQATGGSVRIERIA